MLRARETQEKAQFRSVHFRLPVVLWYPEVALVTRLKRKVKCSFTRPV